MSLGREWRAAAGSAATARVLYDVPPTRTGTSRAATPAPAGARTKALGLMPDAGINFEKIFFLVLTVAAVAGIAYGFWCLLDLVQNWAAMERGISTLI